MLYVVATPIGNLADLSFRALDLLRKVDLIVVEDTRRSGILLKHYNITTKLISLHAHNEAKVANSLLIKLQEGLNIALMSDAGTPLISDPGARLVNMVHLANLPISPLPGASAVATAVSVSGITDEQFIFVGFLPVKLVAKRKMLVNLSLESRALVIFEAPHRLLSTLKLMVELFGEARKITFCRELTKKFETIRQANLVDLYNMVVLDAVNQTKGEIVLVISGKDQSNNSKDLAKITNAVNRHIDPKVHEILAVLLTELPLSIASKLAAKITGISKKMLYEYGLSLNLEAN